MVILVRRFPPYLQGSPLQMAANPQSMFNNYSLLAGNNMASQHPLLPHVNAMNLQTNIALASILRRAELLRQHRLNSASNAPAFRGLAFLHFSCSFLAHIQKIPYLMFLEHVNL